MVPCKKLFLTLQRLQGGNLSPENGLAFFAKWSFDKHCLPCVWPDAV